MNVALLDNGISYKDSIKNKIFYKKEFLTYKNLKPVHGTTCAEIISSICSDVQFWDLRILYQDGTTKTSILVEALEWCIRNKMKLIHMSLGSIDYFDIKRLEPSIKKLKAQDAIIVAAHHNINIKTYPATFSGVFGVRQDYHGILKDNQFIFQEQRDINRENSIVAHWWRNDGENPANSFAAPVVTGYIAKFLNKKPEANFGSVMNFLEERAIKGKAYPDRIGNIIGKDENIEIPVIAGVGLHYEEMRKLTKLFQKKDYQTLLLQERVTDVKAIPIDYYGGAKASLAQILYTVNWIYKPDVILLDFMSSRKKYLVQLSDIDVYLFFENQIYKIYAEKLIGTTKVLEETYDIICRYFG